MMDAREPNAARFNGERIAPKRNNTFAKKKFGGSRPNFNVNKNRGNFMTTPIKAVESLVNAANRRNREKDGVGEIRIVGVTSENSDGWYVLAYSEWGPGDEVDTFQCRVDTRDSVVHLRDSADGDVWSVRASGYALDRFVFGL